MQFIDKPTKDGAPDLEKLTREAGKLIAEAEAETGLVGAETLLEKLFPDDRDRPSLRTLREWQAQRLIPYKKGPGRMVRFSVPERTGRD